MPLPIRLVRNRPVAVELKFIGPRVARRQTGVGRSSMGSMNPALTFLGTTLQALAFPEDFKPVTALTSRCPNRRAKDLRNTSAQEVFSENDALCQGILNVLYPQASAKKMVFKHSPLPKHPELLGSYCSLCGKLVAASPNPTILIILERLHECQSMENKQLLKAA